MLNAANQSSGLTLVAATHVFLVEPLMNPAVELQVCACALLQDAHASWSFDPATALLHSVAMRLMYRPSAEFIGSVRRDQQWCTAFSWKTRLRSESFGSALTACAPAAATRPRWALTNAVRSAAL